MKDDYSDAIVALLPEPWYVVPTDQRAPLVAELRAELAPGHLLFGLPVIAVARCTACDDVIFSVETDAARWARVHLTWRQDRETPPWPMFGEIALPLHRSLLEHEH